MSDVPYRKPERWKNPTNKLFAPHVGFTCPPHHWDAAPSDFLRIAPPSVGVHGRMLHASVYAHTLSQRKDNFHLLARRSELPSSKRRSPAAQCSGTTPTTTFGMRRV